MSTRVVLLREGLITQIANPQDLYLAPSSEFAANFIGDANVLQGHVVIVDGKSAVEWRGVMLSGPSVAGRAVGTQVNLMVRPEAIRLAGESAGDDQSYAEGRIERSSFYGFYWIHRVKVGGQLLIVRELGSTTDCQPGTAVRLMIDTERVVVLPGSKA